MAPRRPIQGAFVIAHLPASTAEALFQELGAMPPSRSTLDRLPRTLSAHWEAHRADWEAARQAPEVVPIEATTLALSVDGVRAPRKPVEAERAVRAAQRTAPGKQASGPTGYREVGCGSLTWYDRRGERSPAVLYVRMPEHKKGTLGEQLHAEAQAILKVRPDLRHVSLADGAETNWEWLAEGERAVGGNLLESVQLVDCHHACAHLTGGDAAIWGESTPRGHTEFARLRVLLKEADEGAERIIQTLKYHRGRAKGFRRKRMGATLTDFPSGDAGTMRLTTASTSPLAVAWWRRPVRPWSPNDSKARAWPGRWLGGQAILTLRRLLQSDRWP